MKKRNEKSLAMLILLCWVLNSAALPTFTTGHVFDSTVKSIAINYVDFNNDNTIDILTQNYILLNDGEGHFTQHQLNHEFTDEGFLFDINNDGFLDFVRVNNFHGIDVTPFSTNMLVLPT